MKGVGIRRLAAILAPTGSSDHSATDPALRDCYLLDFSEFEMWSLFCLGFHHVIITNNFLILQSCQKFCDLHGDIPTNYYFFIK
jgi:hypothetical protein